MLNLLQQLSKNISKLNVQLCRDLRTIRERAVSVTSIENPRARVVKCWNFQGVCLLKRYALWVRIQLYEIHELLATHYLELEDKDPERTAKRAAKRRSVAAHQAVTGKFPPKRRSQQGDEISALAQVQSLPYMKVATRWNAHIFKAGKSLCWLKKLLQIFMV